MRLDDIRLSDRWVVARRTWMGRWRVEAVCGSQKEAHSVWANLARFFAVEAALVEAGEHEAELRSLAGIPAAGEGA